MMTARFTAWPLAAVLVLLGLSVHLSGFARAQSSGPSAFEVQSLNDGLGDPPARVHRDTPQGALETLLFSLDADDAAAAAHVLDLTSLPADRQAALGPELARRLNEVIRSEVWIDWERLPDRPDGLDTIGGSSDAVAGQPRRSIRIALLELDGRPVPIRINRLQPEGGDPVWVFADTTVREIEGLHDRYGPNWLERWLPGWARYQITLGLEAWELLIAPLLLLFAAGAGALTYRAMNRPKPDDDSRLAPMARLLHALALPFALLTGALVLWGVVHWFVSFNAVLSTFLNPTITILLVVAVAVIVVRALNTLIDIAIRRNTDDIMKEDGRDDRDFYNNADAVRRLVVIGAVVVGAAIIFLQTDLTRNVGLATLGGASVIALVLGFAARQALGNIMSSMQIAFSKTARIGDTVLYQGEWATVERIHFTYVQMVTWDGRRIMAPVSSLTDEAFENWTRKDPSMIRTVYVVLDHRAEVTPFRHAFGRFVENEERVIRKDEAKLEVMKHDRDGQHVRFKMWTPDPDSGWAAANELREHMLELARKLEARTGKAILPVERELQVDSERPGIAA